MLKRADMSAERVPEPGSEQQLQSEAALSGLAQTTAYPKLHFTKAYNLILALKNL